MSYGTNRLGSKLLTKSRIYAGFLALMLPTIVGMILFNYYPKWGAIKYSLFRWDGSSIEEFRGFRNFVEAFTADPLFWQTFRLVGILLAANLIKMWPCILTAIVLHRLRNEKWQYIYRVLFVVPMVIPGLVWLLIWKSFYEPTSGILNTLLNVSGVMRVLQGLDVAAPQLAAWVSPIRHATADSMFGSVWGMLAAGVLLLTLLGRSDQVRKRWVWVVILTAAGLGMWQWRGLFVLPGVFLVSLRVGRTARAHAAVKWLGIALLLYGVVLIATSMIWTEPTKAFVTGKPAWLGNTHLIIPAILFWGFPWVGTIGVLIYLAGLQNIAADVYEAAELDGVGQVGKLFRLELPLIMTQVRINLIFMTIGTLTDYGLFLLLLGPTGGPGNKGMVPGLYMFREAFYNGRFGYACALGMVLFVMILGITILYQRYVKVDR